MSQTIAPERSGSAPTSALFNSLREEIDQRLVAMVPETGAPSQAARHSLLAPGKRLRAILTLLSAQQCGGDANRAMDAACAVEMVHTASLIFDDLPAMDDAALRRGVATSHVMFGDDVAILAGIGLMNGAFGVVSRCEALSPAQRADIVTVLSDAIGWEGLVQGQALDLQSATASPTTCVEDIHYGKTGALFVAAALAGAITADAGPGDRAHLCTYGRELGLAYQAYDDVLDQVADDKVAGKSTGRDTDKVTALSAANLQTQAVDGALSVARAHLAAAQDAAGHVGEGPSPLGDLASFIGTHFERTFATGA